MQKLGGETRQESNTQINFPRRETQLYSSMVWNDSKCSKVFSFFWCGHVQNVYNIALQFITTKPLRQNTHTSERAAGVQLYSAPLCTQHAFH